MRRYPPRAPSARGGSYGPRFGSPFPVRGFRPGLSPSAWGFCLGACRDSLAPTRAVRPGPSLAPGRFCPVAFRVLFPVRGFRPGLSLAPGRFSLWESPQRSGDVARIRCVPRVSVPKPCIRASAPHAPVFRGSRNTIDMQGFARCGLLDAARLLREAVSFAAVRLCRGLLRKRAAFSRWNRRTSGMASFDARFKSLLQGARFARLPGAPLRSSSRRVSRESGRRRRRFPPLRRLSGQCA